jgi:hypothetical protein
VDQIGQTQLQEQIGLLTQCQLNSAKLEQLQNALADIASRQPVISGHYQLAIL